ncbi:MAG: MFS transporter [Clostridiales Family XIII bacterium]|jgi:MFS family permease|nr:MFS transporter [Clostridiales Family XIII bacterium]
MTDQTLSGNAKAKVLISLLAMSSVMMVTALVMPILSEIGRNFPDASVSQVQVVYSIASLVSLPIMLLSGVVTTFFSKKKLIVLGLALSLGGGIFPRFFHEHLWQLYLGSAVIGGGIAIVNILSSTLISDYYDGVDKGRVMGYQSAALSMMGGIFSAGAGKIAVESSWPNAFLLSLYIAPIIAVVVFCLPADKPARREKAVEIEGRVYSKKLLGWGALGFLWSIFMFAMNTNISMYIEAEGFGGADVAGYVSTIFMLIGIPGGILLGPCMKLMKRHVVCIMCYVTAAGMIMLYFAHSLTVVFIAAFIYGLGFAIRNPATITFTAYLVPKRGTAQAIAYVQALGTVGGFISPFVVNAISSLFGGSFRVVFGVCGVALLVLSVAYTFFNPVRNKDIEAGAG